MPTAPALASGYSRYASLISLTPIPTLCVLNTYILSFVSLRFLSLPHPSFSSCSRCDSQAPTILLVAPQHPPLVPFIPFTPLYPTITIGPLGATRPSSVSLEPLPSIFLLCTPGWFVFLQIFLVHFCLLDSQHPPPSLLMLLLSRSCHIHSWSGSCVFCFIYSLYYFIPLPYITHILIPLFHPDYPPNPPHLNSTIYFKKTIHYYKKYRKVRSAPPKPSPDCHMHLYTKPDTYNYSWNLLLLALNSPLLDLADRISCHTFMIQLSPPISSWSTLPSISAPSPHTSSL